MWCRIRELPGGPSVITYRDLSPRVPDLPHQNTNTTAGSGAQLVQLRALQHWELAALGLAIETPGYPIARSFSAPVPSDRGVRRPGRHPTELSQFVMGSIGA